MNVTNFNNTELKGLIILMKNQPDSPEKNGIILKCETVILMREAAEAGQLLDFESIVNEKPQNVPSDIL
jgi:hypothetical protein